MNSFFIYFFKCISNRFAKTNLTIFFVAIATISFNQLLTSCGSSINTTGDTTIFTEDGFLIDDSTSTKSLAIQSPSHIKFYVEVSGSMNGFFRPNKATDFKVDVWDIISYYSHLQPKMYILTNDGSYGNPLSIQNFKDNMNSGKFISSASTKVPLMIKNILANIDTNSNEVAILISDMKYSPVGSAAPKVLMSQYSTDIKNIVKNSNQSFSLICATSNYLDKKGGVLTTQSPYYYLIIGNDAEVAKVRDEISLLLRKNGHFVDNIESGLNYGKPSFEFDIPSKCEQMGFDNPTFIGYEDEDSQDTCTIPIKIDLTPYRWLLCNTEILSRSLQIKSLYGSRVEIQNLTLDTNYRTDPSAQRVATATIYLKISNLVFDSDIIEWSLNLPNNDYSLMNHFFEDALNENDPTKSYSVVDFIQGMCNSSKKLESNYLLISKNR